MQSIDEVLKVSDFLNRAADIADLAHNPDPRLKWSPCTSCAVLSALTHAAYPSAESPAVNYGNFAWYPDHIRLREMDVEAQAAIKRVTGWRVIPDHDRNMASDAASAILRDAAKIADSLLPCESIR